MLGGFHRTLPLMSLYKCLECKHEISSSARSCPNCGAEDAGMSAYQEERQKERERDRLEREKDRLEPGWRERKEAKRVRVNEVESKIVLAFAIGGWLVGGVFFAQLLYPSFDVEDQGLSGVVVLVTFGALMGVFSALLCGLIGGYVADYVGCWLRARDD